MTVKLKPLSQQVIVITGASSGIGRATALKASKSGARVVLAARDAAALDLVVQQIRRNGHEAIAVVADVGMPESHDKILDAAIEHFGSVDTWVNNAGVSIFGKLADVSLEDQRKLFDTNLWGVVYGSLKAVSHLRQHGGALINLGSEVSDVALPLQGVYAASKHAVKAYTDSLRMEIESEKLPISVTLIKPASIDTSFVRNAKNYLDVEPRLPSPLYAPEAVADAIVYAAAHPKRDIYVGSASKLTTAFVRRAPGFAHRVLGPMMDRQQRTDKPAGEHPGALYAPLKERPALPADGRTVRTHSRYTQLTTTGQPLLWAAAAALLALSAGGVALRKTRRGR